MDGGKERDVWWSTGIGVISWVILEDRKRNKIAPAPSPASSVSLGSDSKGCGARKLIKSQMNDCSNATIRFLSELEKLFVPCAHENE